MVQSMTGFAVQTRDLGRSGLHLELRSVNSRYLDLGFRIVDDLRAAEPAIRERISARLGRGKVECRPQPAGRPRRAAQHGAQRRLFCSTSSPCAGRLRAGPTPPLSVNELLRWPGMLADGSVDFDEMLPAIVERDRMPLDARGHRQREGDKPAGMIRDARRTHARSSPGGPAHARWCSSTRAP